MAFTSANCLNSPSLSAFSAVCHIGHQIAAFHLQCFLMIWQAHQWTRHIASHSGNSHTTHNGASSAYIISSSKDILKSLPLGYSMITSEIPGWLGFPTKTWVVRSAWLIYSTKHQLHDVWRGPSLWTSNAAQAVRVPSYVSVPSTSKADQKPSDAASISVDCRGLQILYIPNPKTLEDDPEGWPWASTAAFYSSSKRGILSNCSVDHFFLFHILAAQTGPWTAAWTISCLICLKVCCCSGVHVKFFHTT